LGSGDRRLYTLTGVCGIPPGAGAVAVNLAAVAPTSSGILTLWPTSVAKPGTSSLNFNPGRDRSNNAVLPLAADGSLFAEPVLGSSGIVDLVVDVMGYFAVEAP
jgi:hypothetical protein